MKFPVLGPFLWVGLPVQTNIRFERSLPGVFWENVSSEERRVVSSVQDGASALGDAKKGPLEASDL